MLYCVTCIISYKRFLYSCLIFEFSNVQCAYVLKIFICLRIHHILVHYILRHWTKYAKEGGFNIARGYVKGRRTRCQELQNLMDCKKFLKLAHDGYTFHEIHDLIMNDMKFIIEKLCMLKKNLFKEQNATNESHAQFI